MKPRSIADLPSYRVCSEHPFDTTGIDYAGPLLVKDGYTEAPGINKSYILLFTCVTRRCVHLELTPDMSTPTLTLTLRRFVARKGFPETFISDNFKSFNSVIVNKFLRNNKIDWKFILDGSTWWGGFYERLVKVVKDSLHNVVKNARLNYDEVITVLIEIEFNTREMNLLQREVNTGHLTNQVKYIRLLQRRFWKRFYYECTVTLRERMMYDKIKRSSDKLAIGDVVVIKDNTATPGSKCKPRRVKSLIKERDNIVRGAVLTSSTNGKLIDLFLPIQKLIPLEVCDNSNVEPAHEKEQILISGQPRQNAARIGELVRRTAVIE